MRTLGMTVAQFRQAFRTEGQCRHYLWARKYPTGFRCRRCAHPTYYPIAHRGGCWECRACGYQESVKAGTLFHRSKIPLRTWFQGILEFTVSKGGISALELQARLGFGCYETAWQMLQKLRLAMGQRDRQYTVGDLLELDGATFGNRRGKDGPWQKFYVAVETRPLGTPRGAAGFAQMVPVPRSGQGAVAAFTTAHMRPRSTVKTDAAVDLAWGLAACPVRQEAQPMYDWPSRLNRHLPWVHRLIGNIKVTLRGISHGVSPKYAARYVAEYLYRFNRRWWREQLQTRLITACLTIGPVAYADVTR